MPETDISHYGEKSKFLKTFQILYSVGLWSVEYYLTEIYLCIYITFLNELYKQYLKQEQKYIYIDKIDFKYVSIDQDPYQCKAFISIS